MAWWIWTLISVAVLGIAYFFLFRTMKRRQDEFNQMYSAHKEVKDIFVLNKKITKVPVRPGLKFPKVKTYQIIARLQVSQTKKGTSFSTSQTLTFNIEKKQYQKIQVNRRYRVELAGNYIGKVISEKK
jgi:heme/copper-type cytochrome/quinol oxidase subunit 2